MSDNIYKTEGTSYYLDLDNETVHKKDGTLVAHYEITQDGLDVGYEVRLEDENITNENDPVAQAVKRVMDSYEDMLIAEAEENAELDDAVTEGAVSQAVKVPEVSDEELSDMEYATKYKLPIPHVDLKLGDKSPEVMAFRKKHRPALFKARYGVIGELRKGKNIALRKSASTRLADQNVLANRSF